MELNKADKIQINRYTERCKEEFGESLYHYTSMECFLSMMDTQQIWLMDTASMNDKMETYHYIEELQRGLEGYNTEDFFAELYSRIPDCPEYAFCLSKERDDAAQWERYADNAQGVCLCFNVAELCKLRYCVDSDELFHEIHYGPVSGKDECREEIKRYITTGSMKIHQNKEALIKAILAVARYYKHHSFRNECEVRLCSLSSVRRNQDMIQLKKIGGVIKKVYVLDPAKVRFEGECLFENLIDGLLLGPRSRQDMAVLQEYLIEKKYFRLAQKVSKSECPLR